MPAFGINRISFTLVAALIKILSPGPVFFIQERVSLNGKRFRLIKFRTMKQDAEGASGPVWTAENDPRRTKIGVWLRRTGLDELPQFINVLKGEMSIVGPRPPIPGEVKQYDNWHRRRLSMRPGLTCLWQVKGRNKITDFDEWMRLDLQYIDSWSLLLDNEIIVRTIPVVIFGIGAK